MHTGDRQRKLPAKARPFCASAPELALTQEGRPAIPRAAPSAPLPDPHQPPAVPRAVVSSVNMLRLVLPLVVLLGACAPAAAQRPAGAQCHAGPVGLLVRHPLRAGDPLLGLPVQRPATAYPLLPKRDSGLTPWQSAGVGALIGLGAGSVVGLIATNGDLSKEGYVSSGAIFAFCAGTGTVVGGLIGLLAGSSSGGGGSNFPGY